MPLNALSPIIVTDAGSATDISPVQPLNALLPIVLSCELASKIIDVRLVHPSKADVSIDVTEAGIFNKPALSTLPQSKAKLTTRHELLGSPLFV